MNYQHLRMAFPPARSTGLLCLVLLLCLCVVTQMLGVPVTLLGLLDSDRLIQSEPASEDPTVLSSIPEPERPNFLSFFTDSAAGRRLPVVLSSVFRPPLV